MLFVLLQRPGDVVTREELRSQIWPQDTFVDFDNSLNTAINKLREALGDSADSPRFVETLPRRGYRFLAPVSGDGLEKPAPRVFSQKAVPLAGIAAVLLVAAAAGGWFWHSRYARVLTEKDTIVLGDFANSTGDSVFDGTLREGLSVQLEQSPLPIRTFSRFGKTLIPISPSFSKRKRNTQSCSDGVSCLRLPCVLDSVPLGFRTSA